MALVSSSGTPFDKRLVKNNSGAILNVTESENFDELTPSKSSHGPKRVSGPVLRDGDVGETADRAGVQRADSSKSFAKKPESNIVYGAGVNEKLNSRDYSGSLNDDATEENRIITGTSEAGSGVLNKFNILSRPDARISSGRTKGANAGSNQRYINPTNGSGVAPSTVSRRRDTGKLRWSFGGIPQLISYASRDQAEGATSQLLDLISFLPWEYNIPYPSNGIHDDAWIFEIDTTSSGNMRYLGIRTNLNFSTSGFRIPTVSSGYYNCTIDWGDGNTTKFVDTDFNHQLADAPSHYYESEGTYEIKIYGDFRGVGTRYESVYNRDIEGIGDILKLTKIKRWGTKLRLYTDVFVNVPESNLTYQDDIKFIPRGWFSASHYKDTGNLSTWDGEQLPLIESLDNKPKGISHLPKYPENIYDNFLLNGNKFYPSYDSNESVISMSGLLYANPEDGVSNNYGNIGARLRSYITNSYIDDYEDAGNSFTFWQPTALSGIDENGNEDSEVIMTSNLVHTHWYDNVNTLGTKLRTFEHSNSLFAGNYKEFRVTGVHVTGATLSPYFNNNLDYSVQNSGLSKYVFAPHLVNYPELIDPNDNLYDLDGFLAPKIFLCASGFGSATTVSSYKDLNLFKLAKNIDRIDFTNTEIINHLFSYHYQSSAFANQANLRVDLSNESLPDLNSLDFKNIKSAEFLFEDIIFPSNYTGISNLNLSNIESIRGIFKNASGIPDISNWIIGDNLRASGTAGMFAGSDFNGDITNIVSGAVDFIELFANVQNYNHPSVANWDTSNITDMSYCFAYSTGTQPDISSWDVSNVTNMRFMFANSQFNGDITNWDTSSLEDASMMFRTNPTFNQDIGNWNTSNLKYASSMLNGANSFNYPLSWDLTNVIECNQLFPTGYTADFSNLTLPISGEGLFASVKNPHVSLNSLNLSNVESVKKWLYGGTNSDVTNWNVGNVHNFSELFAGNLTFNRNITNWDVSKGRDFSRMFSSARAFNQNIFSYWDMSNATNINGMLSNAQAFNQTMSNWNIPSGVTDMTNFFTGCYVFNQPLNHLDMSRITSTHEMFASAKAFNQDISSWDMSKVTDMYRMFNDARVFNRSLNTWDVSSVTNMGNMFTNAYAFNGGIGNWNVSNVTDMSYMFTSATSFNQDLTSWDVSSLIDASYMFQNATAFNSSIDGWNLSKCVNLGTMFMGCSSYNQPMNNCNLSGYHYMQYMFYGCSSFNQPLNNWDVSLTFQMFGMFYNCSSFNQDLSSWDFSYAPYSWYQKFAYFLYGCTLSTVNYDKLLIRLHEQAGEILYAQSFHGGTSRYSANSAASLARESLINDYGWTITDGGAI